MSAEAGGEDDIGQILVGNVIFNRVNSKQFPNTVHDVIFQTKQFEPIINGAYDRAAPSGRTLDAVRRVLAGEDYSKGALYFRTVKGAAPECWHERALTPLFDHGSHRFYR
ncbi:MAG: cell wall hydrolase [Clostridiales bacterium]|nr:cell wall hydrolase [Clostridiales bacterium]